MDSQTFSSSDLSQDFLTNGYVVAPFSIGSDVVDAALESLKGLYNYTSQQYNLNNRVENAWQQSEHVKSIACDPRVVNLVSSLLGTPSFPFQTLNFERGSQQRLHSDFYHFAPTTFSQMIGVWVALEDVSQSAGPLRVVPGSHKLPYLFPEDVGVPVANKRNAYEFYSEYEDAVDEIYHRSSLEDVLIILKKGQILLWHSNLLHGGGDVFDNCLTRKSQVTHYFGSSLAYFSPITSGFSMVDRTYRLPFDIRNGSRRLPSLGQIFKER